jgi:hypothetical protein
MTEGAENAVGLVALLVALAVFAVIAVAANAFIAWVAIEQIGRFTDLSLREAAGIGLLLTATSAGASVRA